MSPRTSPDLVPLVLTASSLDRANAIYRDIQFMPSRPDVDSTFALPRAGQGADSEPEFAALGRIQGWAPGCVEIGGIWVHPDCRGRGLARVMVEFIIGRLEPGSGAWCLPFAHLAEFYLGFGMRRVDDHNALPDPIRRKLVNCSEIRVDGASAEVAVLRWDPH